MTVCLNVKDKICSLVAITGSGMLVFYHVILSSITQLNNSYSSLVHECYLLSLTVIVWYMCRQHWIRELDSALTGIEERRMNEVRQIFTNYSQQMEKIAHLMVPNLQRLLDHESQVRSASGVHPHFCGFYGNCLVKEYLCISVACRAWDMQYL